jgi:hypothetical protein
VTELESVVEVTAIPELPAASMKFIEKLTVPSDWESVIVKLAL